MKLSYIFNHHAPPKIQILQLFPPPPHLDNFPNKTLTMSGAPEQSAMPASTMHQTCQAVDNACLYYVWRTGAVSNACLHYASDMSGGAMELPTMPISTMHQTCQEEQWSYRQCLSPLCIRHVRRSSGAPDNAYLHYASDMSGGALELSTMPASIMLGLYASDMSGGAPEQSQ